MEDDDDELRLAGSDDLREDLELATLELLDRGAKASSIRRFVNAAIAAHAAGKRATDWLEKRWAA